MRESQPGSFPVQSHRRTRWASPTNASARRGDADQRNSLDGQHDFASLLGIGRVLAGEQRQVDGKDPSDGGEVQQPFQQRGGDDRGGGYFFPPGQHDRGHHLAGARGNQVDNVLGYRQGEESLVGDGLLDGGQQDTPPPSTQAHMEQGQAQSGQQKDGLALQHHSPGLGPVGNAEINQQTDSKRQAQADDPGQQNSHRGRSGAGSFRGSGPGLKGARKGSRDRRRRRGAATLPRRGGHHKTSSWWFAVPPPSIRDWSALGRRRVCPPPDRRSVPLSDSPSRGE